MELTRINATGEPKKARNRCDLLSAIVGTSIHFTSRRTSNSSSARTASANVRVFSQMGHMTALRRMDDAAAPLAYLLP